MESLDLVTDRYDPYYKQAFDEKKREEIAANTEQSQQAYATAVSILQDSLANRFKGTKGIKRGVGKKINPVDWVIRKQFEKLVTQSLAWATEGKVEQALGDTLTNSNKDLFIAANAAVSIALLKADRIDEASKVALRIDSNASGLVLDSLLAKICKAYSAKHHFDKAIALVERIKKLDIKDSTLRNMITDLLEQGLFDDAIKVSSKISQTSIKDFALEDICIALAEWNLADRAVKLAKTIQSKDIKDSALVNICKILLAHDEIKRALGISDGISNEVYKDKAGSAIAKKLAEQGEISHAVEVVKTLSNEYEQNHAFLNISRALTKNNFIHDAHVVTGKITCKVKRAQAVQEISEKFQRDLEKRGW